MVVQLVKNLPGMQKTAYNAGDFGSIPELEDPLREKEMPTCPSIFAWEIPWWAFYFGKQFFFQINSAKDDVASFQNYTNTSPLYEHKTNTRF